MCVCVSLCACVARPQHRPPVRVLFVRCRCVFICFSAPRGVVMVGTGNEIIVIRDDLVTPRCIGIRAVRVCKGYGGDAVQRGTRNG